MAAAFGLCHRIDNDAVTAALAEVDARAAPLGGGVLVVTLGTGVGVAVVRGGQPFRGADGVHPEAGHVTVPSTTDPCYCGRERCFEQSASRTALQRFAHEAIGTADLALLGRSATAGDPVARGVFASYGVRVAEGLIEICTQHRPDRIILGGSAASYLDHFGSTLAETLGRMTSASVPSVSLTEHGDFGGALRAALLFQLDPAD